MSANSDSTQYQCNCRNQKTIVKESDLLEHGNNVVIEDSTQSPTMVPMIEYEVLPALTQTTSAPATLYTPEEPAITQCILIKIPSQDKQACVCSENYSQCTENSCCHKRMRSMRPGVAKSSPSKTENAVDLLMDVLKKIKTNL
uniref:Phlebovirus_G2 domain-containing protein n=1 Tax=Rhabditophanes sp. KR3021 TaxID=114890 RepID=A0AC35U6T3_9BILA